MPAQSRVAFAASCAQRLIGAYRGFAENTGRSAVDLENALECVWAHVQTKPPRAEVERMIADLMAMVPPESDPRWTPLFAYAEDAVSAVAHSLSCLLSGEVQEAAWAARRVYDALDLFVTTRDDITPDNIGVEDRILQDPLVQAELQRQVRDMVDLQSAGALSSELLHLLRTRSAASQAIVVGI